MADYLPSPRDWVAEQVELYERTGGREGASIRGYPTVIMTMRGRRTGATRKVPVIRVTDGDRYVAIASMGGAPKHPLWYHNLVEQPDIELRDGDRVMPMRARLIEEPAERDRLWALAVEAFRDYAEYQTRTERVIPVFALEPA